MQSMLIPARESVIGLEVIVQLGIAACKEKVRYLGSTHPPKLSLTQPHTTRESEGYRTEPNSSRPRSAHVVVGFGCPRRWPCCGERLREATRVPDTEERAGWGWESGSWTRFHDCTHTKGNGYASSTQQLSVHSLCQSVPIHVSTAIFLGLATAAH